MFCLNARLFYFLRLKRSLSLLIKYAKDFFYEIFLLSLLFYINFSVNEGKSNRIIIQLNAYGLLWKFFSLKDLWLEFESVFVCIY